MKPKHLTILFAVLAAALLPQAAHAQYSTCTEFACDSYGAYDPYSNEISGYSRTVDYLWGWYLQTFSSIQAPDGEGETTVDTNQAEGYWEAEADVYYAPGQTGGFSIDGDHQYELEDNEMEDGESYYPVDVEPPPPLFTPCPGPWYPGTNSVSVSGSGFTGQPVSIYGGGVDSYSLFVMSDSLIEGSVQVNSGIVSQTFVSLVVGVGACTVSLLPASPPITVSQSPSTLNLSTGDTNATVTTTVTPSTYSFSPVFSQGLQNNPPNSTPPPCQVNLGFSGNGGSGSVNTIITAAPAGCSGIFNAESVVGTQTSGVYTQITVPPQILIQVLYGEAHSQAQIGDSVSEPAIGVTISNRFNDSAYFPGSTNYQNTITGAQFDGINTGINNGPDPELGNAAAVYSGTANVSVANARCFFSPTARGWTLIQAALSSGATTIPTVRHDPGCYPLSIRQFVYKGSIWNNANGSGAPAFIFVQLRNASDPAVIQIP